MYGIPLDNRYEITTSGYIRNGEDKITAGMNETFV